MGTSLHSEKPLHSVNPEANRWTYSLWSAGLFTLVIMTLVLSPIIYVNWERLPARIQHLPRYVQSQINRYRPRPEFVPPPAVTANAPALDLALLASPTAPPPTSLPPTLEASPTLSDTAEVTLVASTEVSERETAPAESESKATPTAEPPPPTTAPSPTPTATVPPLPAAFALEGVRHEYQRWNNCGPVTIGMQLSYFGRNDSQTVTAPFLKPNPDDKNVSPTELAAYAQAIGFHSRVIVGGDLALIKTLLNYGFPVIVETWFIPEPNDEMGHYLLLTGYDDAAGQFVVYDSFHGPNLRESYAEFDHLWQVFNRTLVLSYPPEQEETVQALLGERSTPEGMYHHALSVAVKEATEDPNNKYAWFNVGSSYMGLGQPELAARAFDQARTLKLPWRMLWYQFGPFEAYQAVGRYQDVIDLTTANLKVVADLEESAYWRGRAYTELGDLNAARRDLQTALRYNSNFTPAAEALAALPQ